MLYLNFYFFLLEVHFFHFNFSKVNLFPFMMSVFLTCPNIDCEIHVTEVQYNF